MPVFLLESASSDLSLERIPNPKVQSSNNQAEPEPSCLAAVVGPGDPPPRQAGLQEVARRHFASEGPWQEAREGEVSYFFAGCVRLHRSQICACAMQDLR